MRYNQSLNFNHSNVQTHFSRAAQSYDQAARLQKHVLKTAVSHLSVSDEDTYLDVGCGTGNFLLYAPIKQYVGVDLAPGMLAQAKQKSRLPSAQFICANAHTLPFKAHSFSHVFSSLVWQWCDLDQVLSEAWRVLKPGGKLLFTTLLDGTLAELSSAFAQIDKHPHVNSFLSREGFERHVQQSKFDIEMLKFAHEYTDYNSVMSLLKELKALGANTLKTGNAHGLSKQALAKLETHYPKTQAKTLASWHIAYCLLEK